MSVLYPPFQEEMWIRRNIALGPAGLGQYFSVLSPPLGLGGIIRIQFWLMNNWSNIEGKILTKTWTGCQTTLKFGMQKDFVVLWKNLKIPFWSQAQFIVKMEFEKYKYFTWFFHRLKYLMCCFEASVQLVPKSYSHPACRLLELQLIQVQIGLLQLVMFNWSPNIYQKWNWA